MERSIVLLLLIVVAANAARIIPKTGTCAKSCTPSEFSKFKFRTGREYHYDFSSDTLTGLIGKDKQASGINIMGVSSFEVISPCEMVLRVKNLRVRELSPEGILEDSPRTADFKAGIEQHELHFAFEDGTIGDLCPVREEMPWVLNFKRGILSMLQNTMKTLTDKHTGTEVDVAGDCKVRYTLTPNGIRREKDLMSCSGRENRESALQSIRYFVRSDRQTAPLTRSTHVCHQTISSNGHVEKVVCEEEHRLHSITKGQRGARTFVTQTLTYVGDSDAQPRSHAHTHRRTTLKFDFEKKTKSSSYALKEMKDYLREVCSKSRSDIRPETPRYFTEIVYRLRRLNERDLKTIFSIVDRRMACRRNNDAVRRLVIDAIPILGNAQSMALMKTMIITGRVSNIEANLWLTSLAFVQEPTHDMLKYLQPLLDVKQPRSQALLGLSAMVHQYCVSRPECYTEPAVQEIGRSLRRMLKADCSTTTPEEQTQILLALKAIGNAGVLSVVTPDLMKCINKEENPMVIRVAATEAFRRMDCSVNRKPLIEVYKKLELDSELRINAYLAVMTCPTEEVLEIVKTQLNSEKVNQVGSFVWTHLTNLAETNDPLRRHLKDIVEDVKLAREFKLDKLKFSRNIEKSVFFKSLNAGGRMESNVIWSQKSFLPRSVSLNLTSHLFGQSYNFLEFNGRIEGVETVLERYFGPDGYFKKDKENKTTALNNKDFQFMDNKFKLQNDRLRAGLGFKVFGHEVGFLDLFASNKKQKQGFNFLEILIKLASNQELDWSKNIMFLDSKITIPTISGLPLELSVNGTASVLVKAKGKLDIRRMVSWPSTFDINGSVQPSGSVEVSAMMGVNAYYTRHGLKMVTNVHTSTQIDAKLKAKDSETLDVDFGMPRDKQEIINFESKFYVVHKNVEKEHSLPNVQRINRRFCTGKGFQKSTGAELCATIRSPAITSIGDIFILPIVGPFSASVALYKRDTHTSYRLNARWQRQKHRINKQIYYSRFARFEISTPNSRVSRRHLLDFALDFDSRAIRLHLESPQRRIGFSGAFTNKEGRKELKLSFVKDNTAYFHVSMANSIIKRGPETIMTPSLRVMIPGIPYISLQTRLVRSPGSYGFNLELKNLLRGPLVIVGKVDTTRFTLDVSASMKSHFFVGSFSNSIRRGRTSLISSMKARYGLSEAKQHTAQFNTNLQLIRKVGDRTFTLSMDHQISQYANCRSKSVLILKHSRRNAKVLGTIKYGSELQKEIQVQMHARAERNAQRGITGTMSGSLKVPHLGRSHSGKAKLIIEPEALAVAVNYRHRPDEKTFKFVQNLRTKRTDVVRFTWDLAAHFRKDYKLITEMEVIRHTKQRYSMISRASFNDQNAHVTGELEIPTKREANLKGVISIGESEVIKVETSTKIDPYNPSIQWVVVRNGDKYDTIASYKFRKAATGPMKLIYSFQGSCPYGVWRTYGNLESEKPNFDGTLNVEWGSNKDALRKTFIEVNHEITEDGNKRNRNFELKWKHPSRNGHVQVGLEKEDYKGSMHLELEAGLKNPFVVDSMYEIDDGWTQKGLMASVTVKTPFKKFERTHLGINLLGQLRYRKAEVNFMWGNNKRIVTTLVIRPTGGANFLATLKIITPFARYSYMRFHLKNELSGNQVQSELISEIGTKKTYLKVNGVNNGDFYTNDLALSVSMNSPFDNFRDVTLTVDHKDDSNQYNSKLEFKWNKDKKISTITNFNYNRNGVEVRTSGAVIYTTPFEALKQGSLEWQHQNTKSMVKSEISMEYLPKKKIGMTLNGLVTEPEAGALRITGKSSIMSSEHGKIDADFLHHHTPNSLNLRLTCDLPKSRVYAFEMNGNKETTKSIEGRINIKTPHDGYRTIGGLFDMQNEDITKTFESTIYVGNTKTPRVSLNGKLTMPSQSDPTMAFGASFKNRIVRNIEVSVTHQHTLEKKAFNSVSELTYAPGKSLSVTSELGYGTAKRFKTSITTPFKKFRSFVIGFDHEGDLKRFQHTHFIDYNSIFDMRNNIRFEGVNNIVAESKLSFRGFQYLRFSHKKNGDMYETSGVLTIDTSKTFHLKSEVQIDPRLAINIKLTTPRSLPNFQIKFNAQGIALKTMSNPITIFGTASCTHKGRMFVVNGLFNMNNVDDIRASIEMKTPFNNVRDVSIMLQHSKSGKEYQTSVIGKSENGRVEVTNIFQNAGTLKNKFVIRSPLKQFKDFTFSFEHRGRFPKVSHKHHLSFDIAGVKANLDNQFDVFNTRLIEIASKFHSNVQIIKKAGFRFTFDRPVGGIETGLLIEWPQDKLEGRIAFKSSPENKVQLKISTPFYYFKELQGLYTLQNEGIRKFKHHIILAFKNEPLTVGFENSLTLKTLSYIDAQLKINTPVDALKSFQVSYHHELLNRGKSFEAKGEYNGKEYSLQGAYSNLPIHVVDVTLKTPHTGFKSFNLRNELLLKDKTNWKFSSELFSAEHNEKRTFNLELKKEATALEVRQSLSTNGKIKNEVSLKTSWEDEKMYTGTLVIMNKMLPKNKKSGQMIFLEATADVRKAISLKMTLRTPFKIVENQWITMRFERNEFLKADTLKTGNLVVKGNLLSQTAMLQVRYSYGKRPSFNVLIQLPKKQDIKLEGSLVQSQTNSYMKMSLNAPDYLNKPWNLMVDHIATKPTVTVSFKLDTSIEKYDTIAGRVSITKQSRFIKVSGRLSMPIINKPIELNFEGDLRSGASLLAEIRGPVVRECKLLFSCKYQPSWKKFKTSLEISSLHLKSPISTMLQFDARDGLKISSTTLTPWETFLRTHAELTVSVSQKRGSLKLEHNKLGDYQIDGKVDYSTKSITGRFNLKTPIEKLRNSDLSIDFERDGFKVITKFEAKTTTLTDKVTGSLEFNYENSNVDLLAKMATPFEMMKEASLTLKVVAKKDFVGRIKITHNKLLGEIVGRVTVKLLKLVEVELSTPFIGWYKHVLLSVSGDKVDKRYKISTSLNYYPGNKLRANVEAEVSMPKVFLTYSISTPYNYLRQSYGTVDIKAVKNFIVKSELYHNALREKITLYIRANDAETKTLKIQWNAPVQGPLKDISAKLYFTRKPGAFEILKSLSLPLQFSTGMRINYHENKEITFSTSLDYKSFRKFDFEIKGSSSFEAMKKIGGRIGFDIEKNVLIVAEATHNKLPEKISGRLFVDVASKTFFVRLITPSTGPLKRVTLDGLLKKSGDKHLYESTFEYHPGQKFSLNGGVKPDFKDFLFTFKVTSPNEMMKEMSGKLTFNPRAAPMMTFELNHNKLESKIESRLHVRPFRRFKFSLVTPFNGPYRAITVDYKMKKVDSKEILITSVKYHPDKVLRTKLSFEKTAKALNAELSVSTPFEIMKKVHVSHSSKWENEVTSITDISHNKLSNSIHLTINYSKKDSHQAQVVLTTPFKKVENIDVRATYSRKETAHKSSLTVNYNKGKTTELHGYLNLAKDTKALSFGIKTPLKGILQGISFSGQYKREAQKHSVYMKAIYDTVKTIEVNSAVNTNINNLELSFSIKTPFSVMRFTEGKIALNTASTKFLRSATPDKRSVAKIEFVHSKLMQGKKLKITAVSTMGANEKNLKVDIKVMGKTYEGKIFYKKAEFKHSIGVSVVTDKPDRPWFAEADIEMKSSTEWKIDARCTSPKHRLDAGKPGIFEAEVKHSGTIESFENMLKVKSPYENIFYSGSFKKSEKTASFSLKTPMLYVTEIEMKHTGGIKDFKTEAIISLKDKSTPINYSAKMTTTSSLWEVKVELDTPFESLKKNSLSLIEQGSTAKSLPTRNRVTKLDFSSSKLGTLKITNDFKMSASGISNAFSMENEIKNTKAPKTLNIDFNASPVSTDESSAKLSIDSSSLKEKITVSGEWKKTTESLRSSFKINAIKDFLKSKIELDIPIMKRDEVRATFVLTSDSLKEPAELAVSWRRSDTSFDGKIATKIPVKFLKSTITVRIPKMTVKESDAKLDIVSDGLDKPIALSIYWKKSPNFLQSNVKVMSSKAELLIPIMTLENTEASFKLESDMIKEPVSFNVKWQKTVTKFSASVESNAPVKYLKTKVSVDIPKMSIEESTARFTITSEEMKEPAQLSVEWKSTATSLKASVKSDLPIKYLKSTTTIDIPKMMLDETDASITVTSDQLTEPAKVSLKWQKKSGSLTGSLNSQIPAKYLKSQITLQISKMEMNNAEATISLTSEDMQDPAQVVVSWKNDITSFEGSIDSKIPVKFLNSKVAVSIPKMFVKNTDASLTITSTELKQPCKISVGWKLEEQSFEASLNSQIPVSALKFKTSVKLNPMSVNNFKGTFRFEAEEMKDPVLMTLSWNKADTKFNTAFNLQTPIEVVKTVNGIFFYDGNKDKMNSGLELSANKLGNFESTMNWDVETKVIRMNVDVQKNVGTYRVRRSTEKIFSLNVNGDKQKMITTIEMPKCKTVKRIVFTTLAEQMRYSKKLEWDNKFVEVIVDRPEKTRVSLVIKSSFDKLKNLEVEATFPMTKTEMEFSLRVTHPKGASFAKVTGKKIDGVQLSAAFENTLIPKVPNMSLNVNHEGTTLSEFKNVISVKYADKDAEMTTNFKNDGKTSGSLEIKTPFKKFSKQSANFELDRSKPKFEAEFKSGFASAGVQLESSKLPMDRISATVTFNKKSYMTEITYKGNAKEFKSNIKVLQGSGRVRRSTAAELFSMEISSNLKDSSYDCNVELSCKYLPENYQKIAAQISTKGNFKTFKVFSFESSAIVNNAAYSTSLKWDLEKSKSAEINVDFPGQKPNCVISGDASLSLMSGFTIESSAKKCNEEIYNVKVNSNLKNNLKASLKSLHKISDTKISYQHTIKSKSVAGEAIFDNEKLGEYKGSFETSWKKDVVAKFTFEMPRSKNVVFELKKTGDLKKMAIETSLKFPSSKTITSMFEYSLGEQNTASLSIETPFKVMKKTEITLKCRKADKSLATEVNFKQSDLGEYISTFSYDTSNSAKVIFTLTTPHKILKSLEVTFNYEGKISNKFDQSIFVTYNGVKAGYSIELMLPKLLYRIEIDTPFRGYRKIVISNEHKGDLKKFSHSINVDVGPGNVIQMNLDHHATKDSYKGNLRFKSPLKNFEDIYFKVNNRKAGPSQWLLDHELQYAPTKKIRCQGIINHGLPTLTAVINLKTPFPRLRIVELNLRHNHRDHFDFDFKHSIKVNDRKGSFNGRLNRNKDTVMGIVMIETPFERMRHFDASLSHKGNSKNFKNDIALTYAVGKTISLKTRFERKPKENFFELASHLDTPFKQIRTGKIVLKHIGTLREHTNSIEFGADNKEIKYAGFVSAKDPMNMSSEFVLNTPFKVMKTVKVTFKHKTGLADMAVVWNELNYVKIGGAFQHKKGVPTLAMLTISTSFEKLKKGSIQLKRSGYDGQGSFDINGVKSNINLRYNRGLPEIALKSNLLFGKQYSFQVRFEKTEAINKAKLQLFEGHRQITDMTLQFKHNFDKNNKYLTLKLKGSLPAALVGEQRDFSTSFDFGGTKQVFFASSSGEFLGQYRFKTEINYNTFKRVSATFTYNDTPYSFGYIFAPSADLKDGSNLAVKMRANKHRGELSLDFNSKKIELEIRTPFQKAKEIYLMINHDQESKTKFSHRSVFRLNKHRYVNIDLSVNSNVGTVVMKAPAVINLKYSNTGERVIRAALEVDPDKNDATKKISLNAFIMIDNDASLKKTSHEASFALKTKYRDFRFETKTVISPMSFFHKQSINTDHRNNKPWKIFISSLKHLEGHDAQRTDDWVLETPVRSLRLFMELRAKRKQGRELKHNLEFFWDSRRAPNKKMGWLLSLKQTEKKEVKAVVTFHHPIMRDMKPLLQTIIKYNDGNTILRKRTTLSYTNDNRDVMVFSLKLSRAGQKMVRGSMSIEQESTGLNTKLSGSFGGNRGVYVNGLTLLHKMDGKFKKFQVLSNVNVLKRSVMIDISTPLRSISWMTVAHIGTRGVKLQYQLAFDKSKKAFGEITLSRSPSFKTRLYFSPGNTDNYVETYGRFVNKKHFEFQIHRMMANRRYSDFIFNLKLQGEHLLKSRLFWRPSLLAQARSYIQSQVQEVKENAKIMWPKFIESLRKDLTMKKNLMITTIPKFDKFRDYTKKEFELVREDVYKLFGLVYDSYMDNDFYVYDLSLMIANYAMKVNEQRKVMTVTVYRAVWGELVPNLYSRLENHPRLKQVRRALQGYIYRLSTVVRKMNKNMGSVKGMGKRHINRGVEKLTQFVKSLHKKYSHLETQAFHYVKSNALKVQKHYQEVVIPRVLRMRAVAMRGLTSLSNYHRDSKESILSHFNRDIRMKVGQVHTAIQRGIDKAAHRYGLIFHSLRQKMNQKLDGTIDMTAMQYTSDIIRSGIKKIQWAYDRFDVEQKLKDFGHAQYLKAVQYVRENSIDVIRDYLRLEQNQIITFQPEKGRIEGQIYVPFQMTDLQSKPDFSSFRRTTNRIRKAFRRPSGTRSVSLPTFNSLKQRILRYIPQIERNPRAWIPTFRGYASIAGKHIVTFDKVHYDLDGNCDYVLSRDFKGQRWSVVLSQATKDRHITILVHNKKFSIHSDHSVAVDGKKVELPFVYGNFSILRFGPIIKAKDTVLGFSVTSDVVSDIHTVGVVGWYHGKLGGLFGNFDNEQYNDMQTVDHRIDVPIDTFIQSWSLRGCKHNNNVGQHNGKSSKIANKICKFLFGCPLSPMAKCFKHVDTKPFLKLCLSDVDEVRTGSPKSRICRSAKLYVQHCKKAHVNVRVPLPCRKCPIPRRAPIVEGKSVTIENTKATADVVFVVEESRCNKGIIPKLSDIVQRMELAFKRRGIIDNRYGLIGFGRKAHGFRWPHSHTVNSQLMGEAEHFTKSLSNFESDEQMENQMSSDPLLAIRKASQYPFRPGASRQVILVPCTSCHEKRISTEEIEEELKDQDIVLYVLHDAPIFVRRPSMAPQSSYLFGIDDRAVYTHRDINSIVYDRQLFKNVHRPSDTCSNIAYSTGGAVFNTRKLLNMHVVSQKWFAQVFGNRVAAHSNSPKSVDCECNTNQRNRPYLVCKKNGPSVVKGVPQAWRPLPAPQTARTQMKLEYKR